MKKKITICTTSVVFIVGLVVCSYIFFFHHAPESSDLPATILVESQSGSDSEGDFYTSDNVRLHYWFYDRGTSVVTIFLHGGPGSSTSDFRRSGQAEAYANTFGSVLTFDQRGGGQSDKSATLASSITYPRFFEDINELREQFIPGHDVIIFGRSFGGSLAIEYANSHPQGVIGYILASPGPMSNDIDVEDTQRQELTAEIGQAALIAHENQEQHELVQIAEAAGKTEVEPRYIAPGEDDNLDLGAAFEKYGGYHTHNTYALLPALRSTPLLVEYGAYDIHVTPQSIELMKPYLPYANFVEYDGGHGAAYTHQNEFFTEVKKLFDQINKQ